MPLGDLHLSSTQIMALREGICQDIDRISASVTIRVYHPHQKDIILQALEQNLTRIF